MKDNFSHQSENYRQYRPNYPPELFDFILNHVSYFETAWDCGTGNGQIAVGISPRFQRVFATDISEQQLANAKKLPNVEYSVQPAESVNFPDHIFDLVIVGQAVHWFDFENFYAEVNRTCKQSGILAIVGYGRLLINPAIDAIIDRLYSEILGDYWDKERKYIDENYSTIPFPYQEIQCPTFINCYQWTLGQLIGYIGTWSALKHYKKKNNTNPIDLIYNDLFEEWKENELKEVNFPILCRLGTITSFFHSPY